MPFATFAPFVIGVISLRDNASSVPRSKLRVPMAVSPPKDTKETLVNHEPPHSRVHRTNSATARSANPVIATGSAIRRRKVDIDIEKYSMETETHGCTGLMTYPR